MQCAEMLSKDTGSRQTDSVGDAPCHVCHVYQSGTRTMEYILCSGPPALVLTLCSATTSATHFLPASVILRSGCWENEWTTSSWVDNTGRQKCELWCCEQDITGKPHSIEFCFTRKLNFSKLLHSPFRKVISLWDLKITFILIKCISCTGNQFTLSPTNKKRDQQKDRPS